MRTYQERADAGLAELDQHNWTAGGNYLLVTLAYVAILALLAIAQAIAVKQRG